MAPPRRQPRHPRRPCHPCHRHRGWRPLLPHLASAHALLTADGCGGGGCRCDRPDRSWTAADAAAGGSVPRALLILALAPVLGGGEALASELPDPLESWLYKLRMTARERCGYPEKQISRGRALRAFNVECKALFQNLTREWRAQRRKDRASPGDIVLVRDEKLIPVQLLGIGPLKLVMEYKSTLTGEACAIKSYVGPLSRVHDGYEGYKRLCHRERQKLKRLASIRGFVKLSPTLTKKKLSTAFGWPCLVEEVVPGISLSEGKRRCQQLISDLRNSSFESPKFRNSKKSQLNETDTSFREIRRLVTMMITTMRTVAETLKACKSIHLVAKWDKENLSPLDVMIPGVLLDPTYLMDDDTPKPKGTSRRWPYPLNILGMAPVIVMNSRTVEQRTGYKLLDSSTLSQLDKLSTLHRLAKRNQTIVNPDDILQSFHRS